MSDKLLELIGDDKELQKVYSDNLKKAESDGFSKGEAAALKQFKKQAAATKAGIKEPVKPECFKEYQKGFKDHAKKCRACAFAKACKGK